MQFAYPLPWWAWLLVVGAAGCVAIAVYTRTLAILSPKRRAALAALRFLTLMILALFLARPMVLMSSRALRNRLVPVLVDISRSMAVADADGQRRIDRAAQVVQALVPQLGDRFQTEVMTFGETLAPGAVTKLSASARRSDLSGAIEAARERYRGRALAGIIVVSDGGDTGGHDASARLDANGPAVLTVGVGQPSAQHDREVLAVTIGDASVVDSLVDLTVSAVSHGFGTEPIELRVLANGHSIDTRTVTPSADGSPVHEVFSVAPDTTSPTLYTVEIPRGASESVAENNSRSVLVKPPGRPRRILLVEGAPGFEQSFLKRAWTGDPGIEVDAIVKKGQNDQGADTFFVQAATARMPALASGFPRTRSALFAYDAIVLANIDVDTLTRDQLALTANFVAERGGGLLILGGRSFGGNGLIGTALEQVLPVELSDRQGGLVRTSGYRDDVPGRMERSKFVPTREGEQHPITRLGRTPEETRERWAALPALAASVPFGGPRPGAQVLAVTEGSGGAVYPMLAIQRYGQGRAMLFAGEASWRWKMLMPATDRTYETFWRQAARWLTTPASDPVMIRDVSGAVPGDVVNLDVLVRDADFVAAPDAAIAMKITPPGGEPRDLKPTLAEAASGTYRASLRVDQRGVYRLSVQARRGVAALGTADYWFLVGGADLELADPRLNEEVLRRIAAATGGRYVRASEAGTLPGLFDTLPTEVAPPEQLDIWNNSWTFAAVVLLLSLEWLLRRRWGMR